MSKRKGRARKRRKAAQARKRRDRTPAALLNSLADALNACEQGGVKVRFLTKDTVMAHQGAVLPLKGGRWEARLFQPGRVTLPGDDGDDD